MDLILFVRSNRHATSIISINVTFGRETEKAQEFLVSETKKFWLPKKAFSTRKTGDLKGQTVLANWFKFDDATFNRIKDFISNTEIVGGFWQT